MDYNKKLESLENEFNATMNHAVEVVDEYVTTCIEKEQNQHFKQNPKEFLLKNW